MRPATEVLRAEHVLILRALEVLAAGADRLERGESLPPGTWEELLEWLRSFADRTHHAREERELFPALLAAGVPGEGGPIATMLEEHVEGRGLIQAMAAGPAAARAAAARRYVELLRAHIDKENAVLFPMAEAVLDDRGRAALARRFQALEAELGRAASLDGAEARLETLTTALAVTR